MFYRILFFGLICGTLLSCRSGHVTGGGGKSGGGESFWKFRGSVPLVENPNYTAIFQDALKKQRPIVIGFYTDWCETCPFLNAQIIKAPPTIGFLEDNFVSFLIDAELGDGGKLVTEYKILAYPTVIYLNSEGQEIRRYTGLPDSYTVLQLAKLALIEEEKFRKSKNKK